MQKKDIDLHTKKIAHQRHKSTQEMIYIKRILSDTGIYTRSTFDRNNIITVLLMGMLPAFGGSAISFIFGICLFWAICSVAMNRYRLILYKSDFLLCIIFSIFPITIILTSMIPSNRIAALPLLIWLVPFLAPWLLIPRLRVTHDVDFLKVYIVGAGLGSILALGLAGTQLGFGIDRPSGGAGNAAVFGIVSLLIAAIAGLHIDAPERNLRWLAVAGTLAGLVAAILSMTRGVWISATLAVLILFLYAPRHWISMARQIWIPLAGTATAAAIFAFDKIQSRIEYTNWEVGQLLSGGYSTSFVERFRLWDAAIAAIAESPVWGYGIQNRMTSLYSMISDDFPDKNFNHAHNVFLNFGLDAGIIGIISLLMVFISPLLIAIFTVRDSNYRRRLFFCILTLSIYTTCGLTQIMLNHDIMDSFIIFSAIIVAVSLHRDHRTTAT